MSDCPAQFSKERATSESHTPFGVLRRVACPLFIELLGCVKWQNKKICYYFFGRIFSIYKINDPFEVIVIKNNFIHPAGSS
jgi:hypothetical protein